MKTQHQKVTLLRPAAREFEPPSHFSPEAQACWRELLEEYGIEDAGGRRIVRLHCEALQTARQAEAEVARDGVTVRDRWGQPRNHPATAVLRDARAQMLSTLRALNLDVIPPANKVGRPGGR